MSVERTQGNMGREPGNNPRKTESPVAHRREQLLGTLPPKLRHIVALGVGTEEPPMDAAQIAKRLGLPRYVVDERLVEAASILQAATNPVQTSKDKQVPGRNHERPQPVASTASAEANVDQPAHQHQDELPKRGGKNKHRVRSVYNTAEPEARGQLLDRLPPRLREVAELNVGTNGDPMTPQQIAQELDLALGSVNNYLSKTADILEGKVPGKPRSEAPRKRQTKKVETERATAEQSDEPTPEDLAEAAEIEESVWDNLDESDMPTNGFGQYIKRLSKFPLLNAEQEVILFKEYEKEEAERKVRSKIVFVGGEKKKEVELERATADTKFINGIPVLKDGEFAPTS